MFQMNEDARNKINYFLDNFSSEIITDFISLLQAKTITLSSDSYELIDKLHISSSDVIDVEQILKKFKSVDTLIIALTLLNEIKCFKTTTSQSTKLVCTTPDGESDQTKIVLNDLFYRAKKSITIIGYLMTDDENIIDIFEMIKKNPQIKKLKIKFIFNKAEALQKLGKKYPSVKETIRSNWEKDIPFPQIYSYKEKDGSLHAKAVIIDSNEILITSANMSGRAMERNIEMGIQHSGEPAREAEELISKLVRTDMFEQV